MIILTDAKKGFDKSPDPFMIRKTQQSRKRRNYIHHLHKGHLPKNLHSVIQNGKPKSAAPKFLTLKKTV